MLFRSPPPDGEKKGRRSAGTSSGDGAAIATAEAASAGKSNQRGGTGIEGPGGRVMTRPAIHTVNGNSPARGIRMKPAAGVKKRFPHRGK